MEWSTFDSQKTDQPLSSGRRDNLYDPVDHDGGERGRTWTGRVHRRSFYTAAALHPGIAAGLAATLLAATVAAVAVRNRT
jgi:hypothetical protein